MYTYIASEAGCTRSEGTFHALTLYIDWASGRIDSIGVNNHICPHSIIDETFNEARQLSRLDIASARG